MEGPEQNQYGMTYRPTIGRYVRKASDKSGVYGVSSPLEDINAAPNDWVNKDFIKLSDLASVTVKQAGKKKALWNISRENAESDFVVKGMKENQEPNTSNLNGYNSLLSRSSFQELLVSDDIKAAVQANSFKEATLTTFDGLTYQLKFGKKAGEESDSPAFVVSVVVSKDNTVTEETPEALEAYNTAKAFEGRLFELSNYTLSALDRTLNELVQPKGTAEKAKAQPTGQQTPMPMMPNFGR